MRGIDIGSGAFDEERGGVGQLLAKRVVLGNERAALLIGLDLEQPGSEEPVVHHDGIAQPLRRARELA